MATILFKDGESARFDAKRVPAMIEAGWSPVDPDGPVNVLPETFYPPELQAIESMEAAKADAAILEHMGIKPKKPGRKKKLK